MKQVSVIALIVAMTAVAGPVRASAPSRIVFTADRAPSLSGEIYRLDPNGQLVDLSNSPFQDSAPVVSSDGQRVAFFSDRSGALSVWESRIDGSGAVQVGPTLRPPLGSGTWQSDDINPLLCPCEPRLAWQPHGDHLALITPPGNSDHNTLLILAANHEPLPVMTGTSYDDFIAPDWSPDGNVLVAYDGGIVKAFSPSGGPLWTVNGARSPWPDLWSWSQQGLLALPILRNANLHVTWTGLRVYDESGHVQFAKGGAVSGAPGWSSDGSRLAAVFDHRLRVFTDVGKRVLNVRIGARRGCRDVVWANSHRVVVGGFDRSSGFNPPKCRVMSVDVRTHAMSSAPDSWFGTRSADGKVATFTARIDGGHFEIGVAPTSGGAPTIYANVPACAFASLQFAGPSRSLVFNTACGNPPTDLYSMQPDGSGLEQVTTGARISDPALSPDGTAIAYSGDLPDGGIGIRDGTGATVDIAAPPAKECHALAGETYSPPDSWPSWSPDGSSILFARPDCSWQNQLYTVPAGGGSPQGLGLMGTEPAWGPTQIAYAEPFGGIWTADPDGTNPVQVSTDGTYPAWSADGRLAYLAGNGNTTVVVGATRTQLPFAAVTSLAWSPDGTRFLVTARTTPTGPYDVYSVKTDGSDPVQLTQNYDALAAGWR